MTQTASPPAQEFAGAVHAGLSSAPKTLPCRFFYDFEGSLLFEEICDLPEYYLTRAEDEILRDRAGEIAAAVPACEEIVELGSGSSRKTRNLLDAFLDARRSLRYLPVDISHEMLRHTAEALAREYPRLPVVPVVGEYGEAMERLAAQPRPGRLVLFLGSNLGNFNEHEAVGFLRSVRRMLAADGRLLMGLDLQKDPRILHAAYNDSAGVTAQFNLNLLRRINAELDGSFDLKHWEHQASYNPDAGRVEMYLVSLRPQTVRVDDRSYRFEAGETIQTEISCKYTPDQIEGLAAEGGFTVERTWRDREGLFSVTLFAPSSKGTGTTDGHR